MVGTEAGPIVLCAGKGKHDAERINIIYRGYSGSVYFLQLHPFFSKIIIFIRR